jgi:hypothetical protein
MVQPEVGSSGTLSQNETDVQRYQSFGRMGIAAFFGKLNDLAPPQEKASGSERLLRRKAVGA